MERRSFIKNAAVLTGANMLTSKKNFKMYHSNNLIGTAIPSLTGGRFVTFCIMIRTTSIP